MKQFITYIFVGVISVATAEEIKLSLKHVEGMKYLGSFTNTGGQKIYVVPFYITEQFYATSCSDCATGWVASRPMVIDDGKDYIPLASGAAFQFEVIGCPTPPLPWRISCFALNKEVHATDKEVPSDQNRIVIRSAEIPAANLLLPQQRATPKQKPETPTNK